MSKKPKQPPLRVQICVSCGEPFETRTDTDRCENGSCRPKWSHDDPVGHKDPNAKEYP